MTIKIKYHNQNLTKLCFIEDKSDWIDLRAAKTIYLKQGEYSLVPLGVSIQLPKGYEAHIAPRSSTYKNFGVIQANSIGIIDESFKGDNDQWMMPVIAMRDTTINENERICQFRVVKKMPQISFDEVEFLGNEDRGGFGSTGV